VIAKEIVSENIVSEKKDKPGFDEQTLARVLEAAYLLQEHNRELLEMELRSDARAHPADREPVVPSIQTPSQSPKEAAPKDDYTAVLAQIVETQHRIQVRHLDLEHAMSLISDRVIEMTRAAGAGIGVLDGRNIRYRAASGVMALAVGTEVRIEKAL